MTNDELTSVGTFCPKTTCEHYGKLQRDNIIKFGRTQRGIQRYRCKSCLATFTATRDTIFYRRRTPAKDILETLALLAEGVRISSLEHALKGSKPTHS